DSAYLQLTSFPTRRSSDLAIFARLLLPPVPSCRPSFQVKLLKSLKYVSWHGSCEGQSGSGWGASGPRGADDGEHRSRRSFAANRDRKSTRLTSSHVKISYA